MRRGQPVLSSLIFMTAVLALSIYSVSRESWAGGGGQIQQQNQEISLGQSTACSQITVNVAGPASVQIEMWYLLGQAPGGLWAVGGPGSQNIALMNNVALFGPPPATPCGQQVGIRVKGIAGTFPVWVSYNP